MEVKAKGVRGLDLHCYIQWFSHGNDPWFQTHIDINKLLSNSVA